MIRVEGGVFQMGSNDYDDEKPIHEVQLSTFEIGKYPITQAQWQEVMGNNPSHFQNCPQCPVEQVSWKDAQDFLKKLNERYPGMNYRLPTEAEWEYAARGGKQSQGFTYAGGNDVEKVGWYHTNSEKKTHPVGQKQPNELGIFDLSGNVWEWCQDWYKDDYYKHSPRENPTGPDSGGYRVLRGGSWYINATSCVYPIAAAAAPVTATHYIGFRLARTP